MKRREFLKLLGAAPVALPLAAKAATSGLARGGFVSPSAYEGLFGEAVLGLSLAPSGGFLVQEELASDLLRKWNVISRDDELPSVEQQMADDDLFEGSAA